MGVQRWIFVFLFGLIAGSDTGGDDFRLPGDVVPDHYTIKILTDLSDNFFYNGEVCIDFLVKTATSRIVLHSKNLKIFENETRVEEHGKPMTSASEMLIRRPKEVSWDGAEFRARPKAELDETVPNEDLKESERLPASEKKKIDVVFDRHDIFEKLNDEPMETSENFGEAMTNTHTDGTSEPDTRFQEKMTTEEPPKKPLQERIKVVSTTQKTNKDAMKPTPGDMKYTTIAPSTMDDKIHFITTTDTTEDFSPPSRQRTTVKSTLPDKQSSTQNPVVDHKYSTTTRDPVVDHKYSTTTRDPVVDHKYSTTTRDPVGHHKYSTTTRDPVVDHKYSTTTRDPVGHHKYSTTTRDPVVDHKYSTTTRDPVGHHKYSTTTRDPVVDHRYSTTTRDPVGHHKYSTTTRDPVADHKYSSTTKDPVGHHKYSTTTRDPVVDHKYSTTTRDPVGHHKYSTTTRDPVADHKYSTTTREPVVDNKHETTTFHHVVAKEPTVEPTIQPLVQPTVHQSIVPPVIGFTRPMEDTPPPQENNFSVLKHEFDVGNNFLTVHLDKPLTAGKKYRLYLNYQGVLADTLTGFHRVPYVKRGSQKSTWLATTVFEPNEARSAFPCFDEPNLKATFDVTLGHDKKYTALSTMPLKSKALIEERPDWQWSTFETTPRMSTYTLAFLVSDLEYLTPRVNYTDSGPNVTYRFWSRSDVLYKTRYAMRVAPEMKNFLENLLQVRDVLPKHDFVALPSFISSALENWGLYSFAEKNLLFTPGFSSIFSKYEITHVLGHEIAHMWFGNMVTPKWWDQIWLSEGFSNFFEIIAADHVQPSWDLKTISLIYSYLKVFTFDALHSSHPLVPRLTHPNDLNEIFDSITYQKGFYLVRMLNYTLGQEAFMSGVRRYLKNNLLSNADENDLWEVLTDSAHQENSLPSDCHLKNIMHAWTRKPGYPIIDVVRDYENHTANVTQRRFLRSKYDYEFRDNSENADEGETKWWVPLTYTTGSELNFRDFRPRVWLRPEEEYKVLTDMPSRSDFVLMNLDAAGLYRVNYDERNWALIISYLVNENSSDISVINRVQILDDLLDLARAGEISYERALEATSYLAKEKHFLPWKAALSNFDFITRMLRLTDSNKPLKKFVRSLVAPRFEELGFESARNEPLSDSLNRKQIVKWACKTGLRQCTRKSLSLFKRWTEEKKPDEHNPIPSSLRSIVYCTAIENGGSKDWQFLWQRYQSNLVTDKTAILHGLGCSKSTRTLRKYLDWSIKESSGIKKQDIPTVFKAVVRNDAGFGLAKNFLRERMGDIKTYLGHNPFYVPQMIETIAAKMNQPSDLEELEELEQAHFSHLRSVPRSFKQAVERVRFNIDWVERNRKPISDWLKKQRM